MHIYYWFECKKKSANFRKLLFHAASNKYLLKLSIYDGCALLLNRMEYLVWWFFSRSLKKRYNMVSSNGTIMEKRKQKTKLKTTRNIFNAIVSQCQYTKPKETVVFGAWKSNSMYIVWPYVVHSARVCCTQRQRF